MISEITNLWMLIVCAVDSDVTFASSDSVLFKIHRKNLEFLSEGFAAPVTTITDGEVIPLVERAEVLELLFQFMYPQRHPDLKVVKFETLDELAEAVEKYQVYPALEICKVFMAYVYILNRRAG
jgi:hypothetical protein